MNWAKTMAGSAGDAANGGVSGDDDTQDIASPASWDPHHVWLTRVKQPRDDRQPPSNPAPAKLSSQTTVSQFWTRAIR